MLVGCIIGIGFLGDGEGNVFDEGVGNKGIFVVVGVVGYVEMCGVDICSRGFF